MSAAKQFTSQELESQYETALRKQCSEKAADLLRIAEIEVVRLKVIVKTSNRELESLERAIDCAQKRETQERSAKERAICEVQERTIREAQERAAQDRAIRATLERAAQQREKRKAQQGVMMNLCPLKVYPEPEPEPEHEPAAQERAKRPMKSCPVKECPQPEPEPEPQPEPEPEPETC